MAADLAELERRLWDAADELRANSGLTSPEPRALRLRRELREQGERAGELEAGVDHVLTQLLER